MGIYIRGMEMPRSCLQGGCPIEGAFCTLWTEEHWKSPDEPYRKRHPNCPLIELFSHGDLIDRDALVRDNGIKEIPEYYEVVRDAPTIIPAEPCNDLAKPNIDADYPPSIPLEQVWAELFGEDGE